MSLAVYKRKRQFDKTPEPKAEDSAKKGRRPIFVVQLHHASRRHYDFRLQVGDTLKSWACPKGPSFDPAVKRLAVEVEDHPISYATFTGDIPQGHYGGGHVDTFDTGVWSTDGDAEAQLQKGHLRFELFGKRLKGGWHLIRSGSKEKKPVWFLMKEKDGFVSAVEADDLLDATMRSSTKKAAGKSGGAEEVAAKLKKTKPKKVPVSKRSKVAAEKLAKAATGAKKAPPSAAPFKPELARLHESPPKGDSWLHEVKWDGYRILTTIVDAEVNLWSRNALLWTDKIPDIRQAIEALGLHSAHLDGELIAVTDGRPDFNALQQTLSGEKSAPLIYMLFDVPYLEGYDLTRTPLVERKGIVEALLKQPSRHLAYSSHTVGNGDQMFAMASEHKLEGIMCKRANSVYHGGRGDDWLKVKRLDADEFAVVGYTAAKGSRSGFGSLLLAKPAPNGEWEYVGRVGSGFSDEMLHELTKSLAKGGTSKPSIKHASEAPKGGRWIKPTVVAEVYFRGIGNQGLLRQPSLKTMRLDKSPGDLLYSDRAKAPEGKAPSKALKATKATKKKSGRTLAPVDDDSEIKITHPDRVVFPDDRYTKQDVANYYHAVMQWFLPGVIKRPTSVIRFPAGIEKASFFQKHIPTGGLKHVGDARLKEETGASAVYIYPTSPASIIELVQYNAIEFHPWGSHVDEPNLADRVVFDLDPGPGVSWARVQAAAKLVRKLLADMKLQSFLRTTGGKGLHIVVPLNPPSKWESVKQFAQGFAAAMAGAHPMDFVATSSKAVRNEKIYVDYLRNGRGATAVASYSLRGRPGAPVAMPIRWEELAKLKSGSQFNIKTAVARLKRQKKDPWDGIDDVKQNLASVIKLLSGR
ncbi:bifunctional non-homologous end joining protein LigD [Rhodanobacter sp. ANJX3]|uniref:DNA ligase D n=1 Tax=Rhodanobacter sp. ANJX3 TaxID=2723083 RepID=UPI0016089CB1|nr:bifunctional non-homologous end joining protein LigD [Rhodanobacter sp. ANJX3]